MTIDSEMKAIVKSQVKAGMAVVNGASLPFRAVNVVVGGVVQLAASSHPVAQEAIEKLGKAIHESYQNSTIGKNWEATRDTFVRNFEKINIPKEETSYFLDSVEELILAEGSAGIGMLAKSVFKTAKRFSAEIRGANPSSSSINDLYFHPKISGEIKHRFAIDTPAEGFILYRYVRGTDNSILVFLEHIQKGKRHNWRIDSSRIPGHTPYCTSQAGINVIKEIGEKLGSKRLFLQFDPENPKFLAFVEKQYPYKGTYYPYKHGEPCKRGVLADDCPIFELTKAPIDGTVLKVVKLMTPFTAAETLRTLSDEHSTGSNGVPVQSTSPVSTCEERVSGQYFDEEGSELTGALPSRPLRNPEAITLETETEENFGYSEDAVSSLSEQILAFAGEVSGVRPALDELMKVNEIVQCLAQNPQEAPLKIVSNLLRKPEESLRNILNKPEEILRNGQQFLQDPAANYMGGLAAVAAIMTWMDSVSWVCEFARKPGRGSRELVKMPYTCVKGVVELGISLIKHPERTTKQLFKSVVKMPEHTVKRFLRAVGLKKKKKKHRHEAPPPPAIDPLVLQRLVDKYVRELPALYCLAKVKGFIEPYKTMEEYHRDLLEDWTCGALNFPNGFFDFPQFLTEKMQANSLVYLRSFSPRAHPDRLILSPEILLASETFDERLEKLETTFQELELVHQQHEEAAQQLGIEQEKFSKATQDLGSTLAQNREKIKQALLNKRNKG